MIEYLPLGNLEDQHKVKPITKQDAVTLLYQLILVLEYLHSPKYHQDSKAVVHRDIKPRNILIESRYPFSCKLADFGCANDADVFQTFCGTRLYAAPEIIRGKSSYTTAVDIWSLGIVVFQYAYGLPKQSGESVQELAKRIHDSAGSDNLITFLSASMLKMDPLQRLSAGECVKPVSELYMATLPESDVETEVMTPTQIRTPPIDTAGDEWMPPTQRDLVEEGDGEADEEEDADEDAPPTQGYVQITIDGKEVSMRKSDYWFNATQIQVLAGVTKSERQPAVWVCYEDGRLLCEIYGLTDTLRQLLEYPLNSIKAQQVGQFINIPTGTGNIMSIRRTDCWVNGSNILKEAGLNRKAKGRVWRNLKQRCVPMEHNIQGTSHPGKYLEFEEGLKLCDLDKKLAPLKELLERIKEGLTLQTTGGHGLKGNHQSQNSAQISGGGQRGQDDQDALATVPPTAPVAGWNHQYLEGPQTWNPPVDVAEQEDEEADQNEQANEGEDDE